MSHHGSVADLYPGAEVRTQADHCVRADRNSPLLTLAATASAVAVAVAAVHRYDGAGDVRATADLTMRINRVCLYR